jgi:proteasome lid subunit RPN8/RPN11
MPVGRERGPRWPLEWLVALAERSPGAEVCGLLVGEGGQITPWPIANAAVTPADAFELDPPGLLAAWRRLDASGAQLLGVYHSHLFGGAGLSGRDLAGALVDGRPVVPGAAWLVVALERGVAIGIRAHRWTGERFHEEDLWWRSVNPPLG